MKLNKLFLAFVFSCFLFAFNDGDASSSSNDSNDVVLTYDRVTFSEMSL